MWQNRIVERTTVKASQLLNMEGNWRIHPEAQKAGMVGVLNEVGIIDALTVYKAEEGLTVIDGHLRKSIDPEQEWPVDILDVDDAEADYILATKDPLAAAASADREKLGALLQNVKTGEAGVQALLGELAERELGFFDDGPPSLDDLAAEYGEPQERDFWPVVKVQVSPDTFGVYQDYMDQIPDDDEAVQFERLMGAVDASVFGPELP